MATPNHRRCQVCNEVTSRYSHTQSAGPFSVRVWKQDTNRGEVLHANGSQVFCTEHAPATYRVLGTTDEVTECEHCGRVDLKGTIILGITDVDGNVEDRTYFGAVCGARAAGKPVKELRKEAASAD